MLPAAPRPRPPHPPSGINYRANIEALKRLGVTDIISVSAVGSLREHLAPGMFVIIDQFIDRTFAREKSFFGEGLVAHVSMARPVCRRLGEHLHAAAREAGINVAKGGTYLVMEGPQFSSYAESELYRTWNCDVIGMTNMPEAKLAREAEMCYATVAMVTDYDCWHPNHDDVTGGRGGQGACGERGPGAGAGAPRRAAHRAADKCRRAMQLPQRARARDHHRARRCATRR